MIDWIDIGGLVLFLLAISLYGLFRDKDPQSMNPRQFVPEDRERLWKFSREYFIVFALAAVIIFLLTRFTKWLLLH
jgi:hypothetical protein